MQKKYICEFKFRCAKAEEGLDNNGHLVQTEWQAFCVLNSSYDIIQMNDSFDEIERVVKSLAENDPEILSLGDLSLVGIEKISEVSEEQINVAKLAAKEIKDLYCLEISEDDAMIFFHRHDIDALGTLDRSDLLHYISKQRTGMAYPSNDASPEENEIFWGKIKEWEEKTDIKWRDINSKNLKATLTGS
jgi:hypothetical protein